MKKLITRCFTISKNPWKLLPIYFNDILLSNMKDKIKTILFCAKKVWEGRGGGEVWQRCKVLISRGFLIKGGSNKNIIFFHVLNTWRMYHEHTSTKKHLLKVGEVRVQGRGGGGGGVELGGVKQKCQVLINGVVLIKEGFHKNILL